MCLQHNTTPDLQPHVILWYCPWINFRIRVSKLIDTETLQFVEIRSQGRPKHGYTTIVMVITPGNPPLQDIRATVAVGIHFQGNRNVDLCILRYFGSSIFFLSWSAESLAQQRTYHLSLSKCEVLWYSLLATNIMNIPQCLESLSGDIHFHWKGRMRVHMLHYG